MLNEFSRAQLLLGKEAMEALAGARVAVFGIGGVGMSGLARILLASPPPQLVVLDEPTNSLDLDSVAELVDALASYRGGLLVVSHDEAFLARLGLTRRLELGDDGQLTGVEPPGASH